MPFLYLDVIEFDGQDTAHGTNNVFSEGSAKSGASIQAIALNGDIYRRSGPTWKISGLKISPLTAPPREGFDLLVFLTAQGATVAMPSG